MNISRTSPLLVALVALASLSACGNEADNTSKDAAAKDSTSDSTAAPAAVELTAEATTAGKCAAPNAETLATFDTAFEGTVTALADGTATLSVDQWFTGSDQSDTVTVVTPSKDLQDLLLAVDFTQGQTYLVSSTDGRVTLCGFTGEKTPELETLYETAYSN